MDDKGVFYTMPRAIPPRLTEYCIYDTFLVLWHKLTQKEKYIHMRTLTGKFPDKMIEDIAADAGEPEEMEWQTFNGRQHGRSRRGEPRITMGNKGNFYLNMPA